MNERPVATAAEEISATVRNRLIESRLTPNAISMVGLAGNLAAFTSACIAGMFA